MWGINGPELDRYITGNYGEDQFSGYEDMCDECGDENCPYDYDGAACLADQKADELEDDDDDDTWI